MSGYQGNQVYSRHTYRNPERRQQYVASARTEGRWPPEGATSPPLIQTQTGTHHRVDAHRVGDTGIGEIHTLVNVHALLKEREELQPQLPASLHRGRCSSDSLTCLCVLAKSSPVPASGAPHRPGGQGWQLNPPTVFTQASGEKHGCSSH